MNYPASVQALAIAAAILCGTAAAAAPAQPSFDCRTHKGTREKAVCRNERLAKLDRAMDEAYRAALGRIDPAAARALRADQRKFVAELDDGFLVDLMGKDFKTPEDQEAALKEALASQERAVISSLEEELESRIGMLKAIERGRSGFAGVWRNSKVQLTVREDKGGAYKAQFSYETYGWERDRCALTLDLTAKEAGLSTTAVHNEDNDEDYGNPIALSRAGIVLHLKEAGLEESHASGWSCPRIPSLGETLIAVSAGKPKSGE